MTRGWEWCGTWTRGIPKQLRSRRRWALKCRCSRDNERFAGHNTEALANSLLITGASQLLTLRGSGPRRGNSLSKLGLIEDGALLVRDGLIAAVGTRAEVEKLPEARAAERLYLGGRAGLSGFVDSQKHLVHAGGRG